MKWVILWAVISLVGRDGAPCSFWTRGLSPAESLSSASRCPDGRSRRISERRKITILNSQVWERPARTLALGRKARWSTVTRAHTFCAGTRPRSPPTTSFRSVLWLIAVKLLPKRPNTTFSASSCAFWVAPKADVAPDGSCARRLSWRSLWPCALTGLALLAGYVIAVLYRPRRCRRTHPPCASAGAHR